MTTGSQQIVAAILAYDRGKYFDKSPIVKEDPETGKRFIADPTAFFLAVLLDMGMPAEYVWRKAPHELRRRLGHLDVARIASMDQNEFAEIFGRRPAIHRYKKNMAGWVQEACRKIVSQYGGNPENIWNDEPSPEDLERRFLEFKGFGQKKSSMAVNIMFRDGLVPLKKGMGVDVSVDVQIRRVFLRAGLARDESLEEMLSAARRLVPDNPGALDRPAWLIGRDYCFPQSPNCSACPLSLVCPKLL